MISDKFRVVFWKVSVIVPVALCVANFTGCQTPNDLKGQENTGTTSEGGGQHTFLNDGCSDVDSQQAIPKTSLTERFPDVPEVYHKVLIQYEQILNEKKDLNLNDCMEKFYVGGEWEDVDMQLYLDARDDDIYYSLSDLTDDGLPEFIMGAWDAWQDDINPYIIYYVREGAGVESLSFGGFPTQFYEGGIILSTGSGVSAPRMIEQFQADTGQWKLVAYVGEEWVNGEFSGYYKGNDDREKISEEEYNRIIEQYITIPMELEWYPYYSTKK